MTKGKRLSSELVKIIYNRVDEGWSQRAVAKSLLISQKAVHNAICRRNTITGTEIRKKLGRYRKTSFKTDRTIKIAIKRNRFQSFKSIGRQYSLSKDTIRRRARESGIKARLAYCNVLTRRHKLLRKKWCATNKNTDFSKWIFSDECAFELADCSSASKAKVHRTKYEKYSDCCIINKQSLNRQKIMVWGAITKTGLSTMFFARENVNSHTYVQILKDNLLPLMDNIPLAHLLSTVFQQDNAKPHTANHSKEFFSKEKILITNWPPLSPDLNIIENVWALMKKKIRESEPSSMSMLQKEIQLAWNSIVTPTLCSSLYQSLPSRIKKVLNRGGLR